MDVYLRFADEAEFAEVLTSDMLEPTATWACDVIGVLEGTAFYHVNVRVRGPLPALLEPYVIAAPLHPKRCFMADGRL
ncbi:MAG: hypothetical protein EON60_02965 [Alphaproteobacteria bacterium]|nr:MAG: hypothetical protein EON60_02965 [Alphaproteobacteria bacterium]